MFKIKWDRKNNGIILSNKISKDESITAPRPVFFEELDLLGFNDNWKYPKSREPLLWAVGRKYFYKGVFVAEAKGGNIYDRPEILIKEVINPVPINLNLLIKNNIKALKVLEGEAIDFIQDTYKKYKKKVDLFPVAFSGGKDSQVVLDLVSRVLAPDQYIAVFTDTTMELPYTYETVENTRKFYKELYPNFKFYTAKAQEHSLDYWQKFGSPSRIHRWCCSVYKTVPFGRFVHQLNNNENKKLNNRILVFEGVRSDESNTRSKYSRTTSNVKGTSQINAEVILYWNSFEVYLYLFMRKIRLNEAYRFGLNRVGCAVCPFSSNWSELIINNIAKNEIKPFLNLLSDNIVLESKNSEEIQSYIKNGQWKSRAGGRSINTNGIRLNLTEKDGHLRAMLENPRENFTEWLKVLGDSIINNGSSLSKGELKTSDKRPIKFSIEEIRPEKYEIIFNLRQVDTLFPGKLKKILNKTTYCVHCGACELECPTKALQVYPKVQINTQKCTHCYKCIDFTDKGCLLAKSISITEGNGKMKNERISTSKYQTFGLRNEWLNSFLNNANDWFQDNNLGLGNRQIQALIAWLKDAELLIKSLEPSSMVNVLREFSTRNDSVVWPIIWTNLYYNVRLIEWYVDNISWGTSFSPKELVQLIVDYDSTNKEKTTANAVNSLVNMFASTPLGSKLRIGEIHKVSNTRIIKKIGSDDMHPVTVAYILYKYAFHTKRYNLSVSEFYKDKNMGSPYKLFGLSKEKFENILRGLQEDKNQLVRVDLAANLDNIFLNENYTAQEVLELNISK